MSTVNSTESATTTSLIVKERKVTATQIERDCPARLQQIGEEITRQFNEAQEHAKTRVAEIEKLLAEARELCDAGGFAAFQARFFPNLRKSRVYEWHAIARRKKSFEETRADTRARVAKHRANKAIAPVSVTVTEKSDPRDASDGVARATIAIPERSLPPKKRAGVNVQDLVEFSAAFRELLRVTGNKRAAGFARALVAPQDLAKLGKLLGDIATLKMSDAAKGAPVALMSGVGEVPAAHPMKPNGARPAGANPVTVT